MPEDPRNEFIDASMWHGSLHRALEILVAHPEVASSDIHTAALLGDPGEGGCLVTLAPIHRFMVA